MNQQQSVSSFTFCVVSTCEDWSVFVPVLLSSSLHLHKKGIPWFTFRFWLTRRMNCDSILIEYSFQFQGKWMTQRNDFSPYYAYANFPRLKDGILPLTRSPHNQQVVLFYCRNLFHSILFFLDRQEVWSHMNLTCQSIKQNIPLLVQTPISWVLHFWQDKHWFASLHLPKNKTKNEQFLKSLASQNIQLWVANYFRFLHKMCIHGCYVSCNGQKERMSSCRLWFTLDFWLPGIRWPSCDITFFHDGEKIFYRTIGSEKFWNLKIHQHNLFRLEYPILSHQEVKDFIVFWIENRGDIFLTLHDAGSYGSFECLLTRMGRPTCETYTLHCQSESITLPTQLIFLTCLFLYGNMMIN